MLQDILTVTGAILQTAENLDELDMDTMGANIKSRLFACFAQRYFKIDGHLIDNLFNSSRMNTTVIDELE